MSLRALKSAVVGSLRHVNYVFRLDRGGRSVVVPVVAGVGRANRAAHEEHVFRVLELLHGMGATSLVDVGVNIGQTLIKFLLVTGGRGRYIGFEPNAKAAAYVEEVIRLNRLANAQVVPVALGTERRLTPLFLTENDSTDSRASINTEFRDASFYAERKLVPVFQGDEALQALDVRDRNFILKIDTEGSELEVVRGMQRTLREQRPFVIMEIMPPSNFSEAVNRFRLQLAADLHATMSAMDYAPTRISATGKLYRGESPAETLTNDYFFIPRERAEEFTVL